MPASISIAAPSSAAAGQMITVTVTYTLGGTTAEKLAPYTLTINDVATVTGSADTGDGKTFTRTFVAPAGAFSTTIDCSWGPTGAQAFDSNPITFSGGIAPQAEFPASLNEIIDSKTYSATHENNALVLPLEGGYAAARSRNTRIPRRNIRFGYTEVTEEEKQLFEDFVQQVLKGIAAPFTFVDPASKSPLTVRFKNPPEFIYKGIAYTKRWDIRCEVQEV